MSKIQSIDNIKEGIKLIKDSIKNIDVGQYDDQLFGHESEYPYKDLLAHLDSLLTDITVLAETPKHFLKISTYEERNNINNCLSSINSYLGDPDNLNAYISQLKQYIRPFHIHYTKNKLINLDKELLELIRKKQEFTKKLSQLSENLEKSEENKTKSDEILNKLTTQQQQFEEKLPQLEQGINTANNNVNRVNEIKDNAENHNKIIDNFAKKIAEREIQLENQNVATKEYQEHLTEFSSEHNDLSQKAKNLIREAKTALRYKKAQGISAAFQGRSEKLENKKWWRNSNFWWMFASIIFILIGISLTTFFIWQNPSTDFSTTFSRLSIIALPLAGAWFCAVQYTKLKNIIEDYAYKTVLAQSIIGFSEQLKNDDEKDTSYQDYMKKMLDEIHQHPVPKHKREDIDKTSTEKIMQIVSKLLKKEKNSGKNND